MTLTIKSSKHAQCECILVPLNYTLKISKFYHIYIKAQSKQSSRHKNNPNVHLIYIGNL